MVARNKRAGGKHYRGWVGCDAVQSKRRTANAAPQVNVACASVLSPDRRDEPTWVRAAFVVLGVACRQMWPGWLRWLTVIAGLASIAGLAFFPFFLLLIWSAATGIWLLVADRAANEPSTAAIS